MDDLFGLFVFSVVWLSFLLSFPVLFWFLSPSNLVQGLVLHARCWVLYMGCSLTKYKTILRSSRLSGHRAFFSQSFELSPALTGLPCDGYRCIVARILLLASGVVLSCNNNTLEATLPCACMGTEMGVTDGDGELEMSHTPDGRNLFLGEPVRVAAAI